MPSSLEVELTPAEAATELLNRRKARTNMWSFCKYTMPSYESASHLIALDLALMAVERGETKRLIVIMPPRHGKSEKISVRFPCWYLGKHPLDSIVQAGYAESIALTHSRKARDVFVSREMVGLFPKVRYRPERRAQETIIPERQAAHEWGTVQGGSYYAVGIGGGLTGRGFNVGIIDDPVKDAEEAESQTYREKVWNWYTQVFYTRQAPEAAIIIVMTRWHADDLVGRLLKLSAKDPKADQWRILHFPAIKDGKALWPERYPIEVLERIRAGQADNPEEPGQGSRAFESLYQGNPTLIEGQIIKREWWKFYKERPNFNRVIHSWDIAAKDKIQNHYSVCTVWGEADNGIYLLDVWRNKVEFPELKRTAEALDGRDSPNAVLVEDASSGIALNQELQRNTRIPVIPVLAKGSKEVRAKAATPMIEAGRVFLPGSAPWLHEYIEELAEFPNGANDDQVDSTTQALSYLRGPGELEETTVVYDSMRGVNMDL